MQSIRSSREDLGTFKFIRFATCCSFLQLFLSRQSSDIRRLMMASGILDWCSHWCAGLWHRRELYKLSWALLSFDHGPPGKGIDVEAKMPTSERTDQRHFTLHEKCHLKSSCNLWRFSTIFFLCSFSNSIAFCSVDTLLPVFVTWHLVTITKITT